MPRKGISDRKQDKWKLPTNSAYSRSSARFFISNARLILTKKNQAKAKQHPDTELLLFENYSLSSSRYYPKIIEDISSFKDIYLNEVILLMKLNMMLKMKYRCDINRPNPRHEHKYTKYKMCFSIMVVLYVKQHLNNI